MGRHRAGHGIVRKRRGVPARLRGIGLRGLLAARDRVRAHGHASLAVDPHWCESVRQSRSRCSASAIPVRRPPRRDAPLSGGHAAGARAAVAARCEPRLLGDAVRAREVLGLIERITAALRALGDRRGDEFRAPRKTLGYGWSVVVGPARARRSVFGAAATATTPMFAGRPQEPPQEASRADGRAWVDRSITRAQHQ